MTSRLISRTIQTLSKSGINYVCAGCGALLYHTGIEGAYEGGEVGFPSRQPREVVERLRSCPSCGRKLNANPDPDMIKVTDSDLGNESRSNGARTHAKKPEPYGSNLVARTA